MTRTFTQLLESGRKPLAGWKVKADDRCGHCSDTGEEDQSTYLKDNCPYCLGTGIAHWLPKFQGSPEAVDATCSSPVMDREELKRLAELAKIEKFEAAASPEAFLSLLTQLEAKEAENESLRKQVEEVTKARDFNARQCVLMQEEIFKLRAAVLSQMKEPTA